MAEPLTMTADAVPVIDIAPFATGDAAAKSSVARRIEAACTETGFFIITGHGVPEKLIAATRKAAVDFFSLPLAGKLAVERPPEKISRGYNRFADRSLAYTLGVAAPPDLQEAISIGTDDVPDGPYYRTQDAAPFFAANRWPAGLPGFRSTLNDYYGALSELGARLMRICAVALSLDEDFFADKIDRHGSVIRLIRYPAPDGEPLPGQLRAGEHTDYGTLTILRGDDVPGGLQVRRRDGGGWIDVHIPPGAFVCNIGDAMMHWTGGHWVSTRHRVANPPPGAPDRISIVFFHLPNYDAILGGINESGAPPITFSEHYRGKIIKAASQSLDAE